LEYEVVGVADVGGEDVGECFESAADRVAVAGAVGERIRWHWLGWKEDNAGRVRCHLYSLQSFCDTNLRMGPIHSCINGPRIGRSDLSVVEEAAQEGQTVARHCAMHPFDEPKKRNRELVGKQMLLTQNVICAEKPRKRSEIMVNPGRKGVACKKWGDEMHTFIPPPVWKTIPKNL
jgi:hypothetical protein